MENRIMRFTLLCTLFTSILSFSQTYNDWRTSYGLAAGSENEDPDNDGYLNREEYAFGLHPRSNDAAGQEFFNANGTLNVGSLASTDIFYLIYRSDDFTANNLYPDWQIYASRWGAEEWVSNYNVKEVGSNTIQINPPSEFEGQRFKCEIIYKYQYPDFDFSGVKHFLSIRMNTYTDADKALVLEHPYLGPVGVEYADVLAEFQAENPNIKHHYYVNSGIISDNYRYEDLGVENYAVWNEHTDDWAIHERSGWFYLDYTKEEGYNRRKEIVLDQMAFANQQFFDALGKAGNASGYFLDNAGKAEYLAKYFQFLSEVKEYQPGIRMINYDFYGENNGLFRSWTTHMYHTLEGVINQYFNGLYDEILESNSDRDDLAERMDYIIDKWTKHGKLFIFNGTGIDPEEDPDSLFRASLFFNVMGRNSFFEGSDVTLGQGGWRHPEWREHVSWRDLGAPLSTSVRDGYVYSRSFEHMSVVSNVQTHECLIKWFNLDGSVKTIWGTLPNTKVTGVSISESRLTMAEETTATLVANVAPANATTTGVIWASSNEAVAKVNAHGVVTAIVEGEMTITATTVEGHITAETKVSVINITGPENLALKGTASQTSTIYNGSADLAIDGNIDGVFSNGSVTHTNIQNTQPRWEVDLGATYNIGNITLFGRTDPCCEDRLANFTVIVFDEDGNNVFYKAFRNATYEPLTVDAGGVEGRVVRVRQNDTDNPLTLAEVAVFEAKNVNLALQGRATQSTTAFSGEAARAIDGDTNGDFADKSVTHTDTESTRPWWQVDLGEEYAIGDINVFNRTNCCMSRLAKFTVIVYDAEGNTVFFKVLRDYPASSTTINAGGVMGSRVRIRQDDTAYPLSLAEVEVFEAPPYQTVHITKRNTDYSIEGAHEAAEGKRVYLWETNTAKVHQQWDEIDFGGGYYAYRKTGTNYCIDIEVSVGSNNFNGQNVFLGECDPSKESQKWNKVKLGGKIHRLDRKSNPEFALEGARDAVRNGGNVYLWAANSNVHQHWVFNTITSANKSIGPEQQLQTPAIYPNPFEDGFSIDSENGEKVNVSLFSASGKLIFKEAIEGQTNNFSLPKLTSGLYLIKIETGTELIIKKMVKK